MSSLGSRFDRLFSFRRRDRSIAADLDPFPHGLKIVAEGENPLVDIVAVHGLDGHRERTWTAENQVNWLHDLLPDDIPHVRIFCWGYDANTRNSDRVSGHYLYDHARTLISELCQERKHSDSTERPIIFIAYSLGGIVVKSALIHSDAARLGALEEHRSIKISTYGIIFLGTPHQGANGIQLGKLLVNIASLFATAADDRVLKHLERDSEWLQQQLGQYGLISDQFMTKFAYEEYPTPTALGQSLMVVPRASAVVPGQANAEPIAIHSNHLNMVKYISRDDNGYKTISRHLKDMASEAAEQIPRRWQAEKRSNEAYLNDSNVTFTIDFSLFQVSEVTYFVAREEELAQVHDILGRDTGRRTAVIHGLGGMGKTQLAIAYAKRHRDDYSAVFWMNARDEASLKQGYLWISRRILSAYPSLIYVKNAVEGQDLDEAVRVVKRWLDSSKNSNWLIIYDNYDNPKLGENETGADGESAFEGYDIRQFFPNVYHGAVLITTRSSRAELGHRVPLRKLKTIEHGLDILYHTSQRQDLFKDAAATELAQELDGLPLALSTAGAYLHNMPTTCAEYLQLYKGSWRRLHITTPSLPSYDRALYSTWDVSYAQVKRQNAASALLLHLWAYFDPEDLWLELLQEGQQTGPPWFQEMTHNSIEFNKAVRVLCDYGLAESSVLATEYTESYGYSIHNCVHAWTIHILNKALSSDLAQLAIVCISSKVPNENERKYYIKQRRLLKHAIFYSTRILNKISVIESDEWILGKLGDLFRNQSLFQEAEAMYERTLQGNEKALGPDHTETFRTMNNLGIVYRNQGRLQEAETIYERALQGHEKTLGPDHIETLRTINNLGIVYRDQGRLQEAETIYERALQGQEKTLGPDHMETLRTINNLGIVYRNQGRLQEAETIYERALQGHEKTLGPDHIETLRTINNLGNVYRDQGRLQEAETIYERALQGQEKTLGPDHIETLRTINNLGIVYRNQGRLQEAEAKYNRALQGKEKTLGPDHMETLRTINNLGIVYRNQGRLQEAEAMYERALQGNEKALGSDHIETLRTISNLGLVYWNQGRLQEAEAKYNRALQGKEKALGPDHMETLRTTNNLGHIYWGQGRLQQAEAMYERALQGYEKVPTNKSEMSVEFLNHLENFAKFRVQQGKNYEARSLYIRCQAGLKISFGIEHSRYKAVTRELESLST